MSGQVTEQSGSETARRDFLKNAGVAAAGMAGLTALHPSIALAQSSTAPSELNAPNTKPYDPAKDIPHPTLSRQFARWIAAPAI